jgi:Ca2+/H+ antiporter
MRAGYLMNYQHEVPAKALARLAAAFCSGSRRAADLAAVRERDRLVYLSCFAVVPLAGWMGSATEELAEHLGHGVGGLLNATFGNAAELITALMAPSKG